VTTPPGVDRFVTVATVGQLAPGDVIAIEVAGRSLVLYRDGDRYYAAQRRCLHQGGDLADGIVSRGYLICPVHGWRFHTATGALDASPETCLATYAVRVAGTEIQVDPMPVRAACLGGAQ